QRVRASHQAIGVPIKSSSTVTTLASFSVSAMAVRSDELMARGPRSEGVAEGSDHRLGCFRAQVRDQRQSRRLARATAQHDRLLAQRAVERFGHEPDRALAHLPILEELRERDEAELRVAARHELVRLRDAFALHEL